jgi:hypothetical protein
MRAMGVFGFVSLFSVVTMIASNLLKGSIRNRNNREAIDYFFGELKRIEGERLEEQGGQKNGTTKRYEYERYESLSSGSETD